jgi:membrane protease YdiL (CAAX protease family)
MTRTLEPAAGLGYHELQRGGRSGLWWSILGVFIALALVFVILPLVVFGVFLLPYAVSGADVTAAGDRLTDNAHATPATLAYLNVTLACAIPVTMFVTWLLHRRRPGWLASVMGRIRWRWLLTCLGLALVTLIVTIIVGNLLPDTSDTTGATGGDVNSFTTTTLGFLLVIVFLTPLQAAGEEYLFRGYLTQAIGGVVPWRWVAVLVPAVVFALFHGLGQDVPVFFDRLAFGIVAGVLVIATGGLEAGVAMHVMNNFLAFGAALAFGSIGDSLTTTHGTWWNMPVTLTQSLVYLALVLWRARRHGVATRTATPLGGADFASARTRL